MKAFFTEETICTTKTKKKLTPLGIQKLLGVFLALIGIASCFIFKEDATAGMFLVFIGVARAISNYTEE